MKLSSKISRLLLVFLFFGSTVALADVDKDKDKKGKQQDAVTLNKGQGVCTTGSATVNLDANNVRAALYNTGHLFWKGSGNVYTVPKSGKANAIFASGIWLGGMVGSELRIAGTDYGPFEFFPGPLDAAGNAPADCAPFDKIYIVSRTDIQDFEAGAPHTADIENWPWQLGAPVSDGDGNPGNYNLAGGDRPGIIGDQTAWWVMNDAGGAHGTTQSSPLKLEAQVTAFSFNTADALNNTTFYKYKLIYRGAQPMTDVYFGIWSDPDLGNAADDFVGSDTTLGMGIVYNGAEFDAGSDGYGSQPPALGYDFFQGPLVNNDGVDNDGDGDVDEADERIAMTKFVYYNNDSTPFGNPTSGEEMYGYLRGIWRDGLPITLGGNGYGGTELVDFIFPGDPVGRSFWSEENTDGRGARNQPADRRFLMSAGPFKMNPGDVQEIVYGIVWAQSVSRLASVAQLKFDDVLAQGAFNSNFNIPPPPDAPVVDVEPVNEGVTLTWTNPPTSNNYLGSYDVKSAFLLDENPPDGDVTYTFEGYRIIQYDSPQDQTGRVIATYDVANNVTTITDQAIDLSSGAVVSKVVATGSDNGVRNFHFIPNLTNYTSYHFGIQAYAYNQNSLPKIYASPVNRFTVEPARELARRGGTVINAASGTVLESAREKGSGDPFGVFAEVVDPSAVTGHKYVVKIYPATVATATDTTDVLTYDIIDATTGEKKVNGADFIARNKKNLALGSNVAIVDGLSFSVSGAPAGMKAFLTVANGGGPLDPPDTGTFSFNGNGFPTPDGTGAHCSDDSVINYAACNDRPTQEQQVGPGRWGINVGGGDGTFDSYLARGLRGSNPTRVASNDFEWRFTGSSMALRGFEDDVPVEVPFELWNIGAGTPNDPSDDYRMLPLICEAACGGGTDPLVFDIGGDHPVSGGANDPITDWIYWFNPVDMSAGQAGYQAWESAINAGDIDGAYGGLGGEVLARQVIVGFNAGTAPPYPQALPEPGTIFRIVTNKPLAAGDEFAVNSTGLAPEFGVGTVALESLETIGIVPNPYKGSSEYEVSVTADKVRFTNLPDQARIRVYTLGGSLIWDQIRGNTNNEWDLTTSEGLPIASGMYLVVVEVDGVGKKIIKFGVVKKRIQLDLI